MAVANLITPVNAPSDYPTIPAGSRRLLFLTVAVSNGTATNVTAPASVTVGGVTMTFVGGDAPGTVQIRNTTSTFVIFESQIASMSGSAIVVSGQSGSFTDKIAWASHTANQATPTRTAKQYITTGGTSISLARAAESWTFLVVWPQVSEDLTLSNPSRTSRISNLNIGYAADTLRTVNSTSQSKTYIQNAHVINIEPPPAQSITSVNGGAGVKIGSTGNAAITDGFPSAPNAGTFGGRPITVTAYDTETKVATFDAPDVVGGESFPPFTGTQTLVLTNGTESASLAGVPISPPTGSTLVTVATPNNIDQRAFGHLLVAEGVTPEDGDTFYGVDADVGWLPTTFGSAAAFPVLTPVKYRKTSTGIAYELMLTVNGEGVVPPEDAEITSTGTIRIGGTAPVTVTGFGTVNAGTLDGKALTAASNTSITMAALADGVATYRPGARTLSLTDGTKTGTISRNVLPPSGWGAYTITGDFVQAINGVAATYLPVGWASTDFILYPLSPSSGKTTTVGDAGVVTGNVGTQELFLVDAATGMATAFDVVTTAGAGSVGTGGSNQLRSKYLKGAYL